MAWAKLHEALVQRFYDLHPSLEDGAEMQALVKARALASVPEAYWSGNRKVVRLPRLALSVEEEEGEEEEEEAEREAAKALAASASREVMLPSLYPHPLEPCVKGSYCDHRGPGCNFYPTVYSSVEYVDGCTWGVCQVHVDICMQIHIYM